MNNDLMPFGGGLPARRPSRFMRDLERSYMYESAGLAKTGRLAEEKLGVVAGLGQTASQLAASFVNEQKLLAQMCPDAIPELNAIRSATVLGMVNVISSTVWKMR